MKSRTRALPKTPNLPGQPRLPRPPLGGSLLPRLGLPSLRAKPKKPTLARRPVGDEDDLFVRASRAYARARAAVLSRDGGDPQRPTRATSGLAERGVYALRNERGLLARYRIDADGSLRQMVD